MNKAAMMMLAMMSAVGGPLMPSARKVARRVEKIELFLEALPDSEARKIWCRRMRRGLTDSEASFVAKQIAELEASQSPKDGPH